MICSKPFFSLFGFGKYLASLAPPATEFPNASFTKISSITKISATTEITKFYEIWPKFF